MPENQPYSPTNPTPYQPVEMPQPQAPLPSPLPAQGPDINGAVRKSGAIATIADGVLRGFMQGRAYAQARQVMKLKKKSDDLTTSYNLDAQQLLQMTQSGVDQNSAEYKQTLASVQGSWGALMDFYGQHIEQQSQGKKSKGKKAEDDILSLFKSGDPISASRAWYQVAQKAGPPVMSQIASLNTQQAQNQRKAQETATQVTMLDAQQALKYSQVLAKPEGEWSNEDKSFVNQYETTHGKASDEFNRKRAVVAQEILDNPNTPLTPAKQMLLTEKYPSGATKLYNLNGGGQDWFHPGEEPEGSTPAGSGNVKQGSEQDFIIKKYGENPTAEQILIGRREWAEAGHVAGAGGAGAPADKSYQKWRAYYKEHYPGMPDEDVDAMARRKVEGASSISAGEIQHDALTEPKQFDNDVLSVAIDNMRKLPQYSGNSPKIANLDNALENIVGLGDYGYQYHMKSNLGQPDSDGKYSGDVTQEQLKTLERDLQNQIRVVLAGSKVQGLSPQQRRQVMNRMAPLFGPAAGSGPAPASPQANAAPPAAPDSSQGPQGGSKGTVRKSAFLRENKGATDADWDAVKPQLKAQGYDVKDE